MLVALSSVSPRVEASPSVASDRRTARRVVRGPRGLALLAGLVLAVSACAGPTPPTVVDVGDPDHDLAMWEMAYGGATEGGPHPLRRVVAARVAVAPSAEILADPVALAAARDAAAAVTSAAAGAVVFEVGARGQMLVDVVVDPTYTGACGAVPMFAVDGVTITGGRVVCSSLYWAGRTPVVTHELLHILGLAHSTRDGDIMCACTRDPNRTISGREAQVVREMLRLAPGTAPGGSR